MSGWQTNAPIDAVTLDRPTDEEDRVTCLGASPSSPVVLVADQPLVGGGTVPYFEVTMLEGSSIIVGLLGKIRNNDGGGAPGRRGNSIGLFSNGDLVCTVPFSECSLPFSAPFGMLDTVGIGCMTLPNNKVRAFATHNGRDLGTIIEASLERCPLYPAISFEDSGCIVTVKRSRPFLFELPPQMLEPSLPAALTSASVPPPPPPPPPPPLTSFYNPPSPPLTQTQPSPGITSASMPTTPSPNGTPPQNVHSWLAHQQASFSSSTVGRKLSRMFTTSASKSSRLEADLLEAQEHIAVLANVLTEQNERQQHDLLKELTVSCRKLLVRHANLVREATDDESLNRILELNDRIIELLASADRILERTGGAPPKTVAPTTGVESVFGLSNLVARGSADTVSEMLFMLRSGTARSQKNAVQCLARLVRERTHNDMVVINGGIHAFVMLTKSDQADIELRKLSARALAELASWVRLSTMDDDVATTRGVFKADLADVLKTMELIIDDDPLLTAQAVSNLVLLITSAKPTCSPVLNESGIPLLLRILANDMDQLNLVNNETIPLSRSGSVLALSAPPQHRRSASWTPNSSSSPAPPASSTPLLTTAASTTSGATGVVNPSGMFAMNEERKKGTVNDFGREASRIAAFGLSLLIRRCDSARTVVVNLSTFFPILEKMLLINDEELQLHALCCVKGLMLASSQDDGFCQGFITARVLQSPLVLQNLFRVSRRALQGSARHHFIASLGALVEHNSVLAVLLETISFSELIDALFVMLGQVLEASQKNEASMSSANVGSLLVDESSFFNVHFRQQQSEINAREKKTRLRLSEFTRVAPAGGTLGKKFSAGSLIGASSGRRDSIISLSGNGKGNDSSTSPSILWELLTLSTGILKVLLFITVGSQNSLPVEYFESIVALSQLETIHEEAKTSSDFGEEEYEEMFCDLLRKASSILVIMAEKFKVPDAKLVSSGLLSLSKSHDESVKEMALKAISEAANNVPELSKALVQQDCAIQLCEDKVAQQQIGRAAIASTITGLAKHGFFPGKSLAISWDSFHGFGPNEVVARFLLDTVEKFETDPDGAMEACRALTMVCSQKSALAVHYRCHVMKRIFCHVAQMSARCHLLEGRKAAEDLIKACGFSQGALQVVANDAIAIREWASIKVDLEVAQVLLDTVIAYQCEQGWSAPPPGVVSRRGAYPVPFYEDRVDGLRIKLLEDGPHAAGGNGGSSSSASAGLGTTHTAATARSPPSRQSLKQSESRGQSPNTPSVPVRDAEDVKGGGGMHQKFMSTVADLKHNPPSKWLEVVANGLGHADTYEKLAREADSKTKFAASIFRAFSGNSNSSKPFFDYHLACIETKQLLQLSTSSSSSQLVAESDLVMFPGVEHSLPPTLRDLLLRVFWGIGSIQRYLNVSHQGFLTDEPLADTRSSNKASSITKTASTTMMPSTIRVLRLQSNVNYWTEKLVYKVISEQAVLSKGVSHKWGLVLPGTAVGDSDEDKNRLTQILFSCPSICSLTFSGKVSGNVDQQQQPGSDISRLLEPIHRITSTISTTSSQGSADSSAGGESSLPTTATGADTSQTTTTTGASSSLHLSRGTSLASGSVGSVSSSLTMAKNGSSIALKTRLEEEKLAQFMVNLPSTVNWLNFDRNCTSAEGLRLIAAFLGVRADLVGCSVTNSTYSIDELSDILRFMSRSALSNTLRYVDLSGNTNLGDAGCATVVKAFVGTNLVGLDLAGIKLNNGGMLTIDALLGVSSTSVTLARDARGEARIQPEGLLSSSNFRYLGLARCSLGSENASRLLYALSKRGGIAGRDECSLRVLDLDKNGLRNVRQPLVSFLAFDTSVREFGFAENEITPFISDVARALSSNRSMQVFRHSCALSTGSASSSSFASATVSPSVSSPTTAADTRYFVRQIEQSLKRNRLEWMDERKTPPPIPVSPRHFSDGEDEKLVSEDVLTSLEMIEQSQKRLLLHVLFSSPLVLRDETGKLQPVDALDCDAEKQTLLTSLEEAHARNGSTAMDIRFDFGCTTDTLISVLTRKPTAVHFSSHGDETYIAMEDGKGGMHALRTEQLEEICRAADVANFLNLVFVSACNSMSVANAFHSAGVRSVVAVNAKISDKAAQVFTRAFYLSIALGDPINLAFNIAREAVRSSPLLNEASQMSGNSFVLVGDGKDSVFPKLKHPLVQRPFSNKFFADEFPDPKKWRLTDSKFLEVLVPGRNVDAYLTIVALSCKRVVTVLGPEGYGKSAILSGFVCKFLNERRMFDDGVVVLDLAGCRSVSQVQAKLNRLVRKSSAHSSLQHQSSSSSTAGALDYGPDFRRWEEEEDDELERTIFELAKRRCALILDHVDEILDEAFDELRLFLGHLLDRTKGLRIVIATRCSKAVSIPGHDDLVHKLGPLSFLDSAKLFLKCCPHYHNDVHARPRLGGPLPDDFELGLARHPICAEMKGVAKTIVQTASVVTYEQWMEIVEEVTEALLVPNFGISLGNTVQRNLSEMSS